MVPFKTFRGPLFHKPVSVQVLFSATWSNKPALTKSAKWVQNVSVGNANVMKHFPEIDQKIVYKVVLKIFHATALKFSTWIYLIVFKATFTLIDFLPIFREPALVGQTFSWNWSQNCPQICPKNIPPNFPWNFHFDRLSTIGNLVFLRLPWGSSSWPRGGNNNCKQTLLCRKQ